MINLKEIKAGVYAALVFLLCFLLTACGSDEPEGEVNPIRFGQTDFTIRFATTAHIGFADGGGKYELTASRPEVLGKFYIDEESRSLVVTPASVGESTLTILDVRAHSSVTLNFTVEDFYLSFRVDEIEGENHNPYLSVGNELRFIRDDANSRRMKVMWQNKVAFELKCIAYGCFNIERSETNTFTLDMALHFERTEELEAFSYVMSGDWEYMALFEKYFDYDWANGAGSKSMPPKHIKMILTDPSDDTRVVCSLQPF